MWSRHVDAPVNTYYPSQHMTLFCPFLQINFLFKYCFVVMRKPNLLLKLKPSHKAHAISLQTNMKHTCHMARANGLCMVLCSLHDNFCFLRIICNYLEDI